MSLAIRFENVSKCFMLRPDRPRSFQEMFLSLWRRSGNGQREKFWALRDVDLEVRQGETVGVIGPNGAGKSTALKLATRILEPTTGHVEVKGRVSALLELGAGFHPDLTGRENVFLNGSILGLNRRRINEKFDEIVDFAGIGRFIDVPVKRYSSGMQVRLGFSIAVAIEPDVLLVDEVLAVGDQAFQDKCLNRVNLLKSQGTTILFVSHSLNTVRELCDRVVWLEQGSIRTVGEAEMVIDRYLNSVDFGKELRMYAEGGPGGVASRWGLGVAEITAVHFFGSDGQERRLFETGGMMRVRMEYSAPNRIDRPAFGIAIHRNDGVHINGPNTVLSGYDIDYIEGEGYVDYIVPHLPLLPGEYQLTCAIYDYDVVHAYDHHHRMYPFVVGRGGTEERDGAIFIPCQWHYHPYQKQETPSSEGG